MVVDAAIVVLENIYRLREKGHPASDAAYHGAQQVWGAVLVSALTTVMVFIPILVMELEAGQLFRDIAVAISVSVMLSLVVSITVIPAICQPDIPVFRCRRQGRVNQAPASSGHRSFRRVVHAHGRWIYPRSGRQPPIRRLHGGLSSRVAAAGLAWKFLPKLEYLPEGNRNLIFGIIIPPPGYNLRTTSEIAEAIEQATRPHWAIETGPESAPGEPTKIERFFFVATRATTFVGAIATDSQRAGELIPVLGGSRFQRTRHIRLHQPAVHFRPRHRRRPQDRARYFGSRISTIC